METITTEIAPGVFRIATYLEPPADLIFSQFLLRDEEPLLYHTGMHGLFPAVLGAVATLIDPATIRWIGFSHFEVDECGALADWLSVAPHAQPVCSLAGARVNMFDYSPRRAKGLADGEVLHTGRRRLRFVRTPHLPHGWDAGHLFDEEAKLLLSSDILHQKGDAEPVSRDSESLLERSRAAISAYEGTPMSLYFPYSATMSEMLRRLAELEPSIVATMHGSVFIGDGRRLLLGFERVLQDVYT